MNLKLVVAIGYSEGGLEPLFTFFDQVPHDQPTYVILRHVPLDQRSTLTEILQRHSKLEILEAEDGMAIDNDVVYIPPSNSYMTIRNDTLYLQPRVKEALNYNYSIDIFFKSLAEAKRERSIAVILSGNGIDGAEGVLAVNKAGGMVIVQDPSTCANPDMPQKAIDTGCADHILHPAEMPLIITKHIHPILKNANEMRRLRHSI